MGRNAKLRKQRKESALAEASSLTKQTSKKKESKNQSFLGKITSFFKPSRVTEKYQACIDASDFFSKNTVIVAGTAWEGYQKYGKGIVFVRDSDAASPHIEYIERKLLKKSLRKHGVSSEDLKAMDNMLEVYQPEEDVVLVSNNNQNEISASTMPKVDPVLSECYRMMQETT